MTGAVMRLRSMKSRGSRSDQHFSEVVTNGSRYYSQVGALPLLVSMTHPRDTTAVHIRGMYRMYKDF